MTDKKLKHQGVLAELVAKLKGLENKTESQKKTLDDLVNIRFHILLMYDKVEELEKANTELCYSNANHERFVFSQKRLLKAQDKELKEIKEVLHNSI